MYFFHTESSKETISTGKEFRDRGSAVFLGGGWRQIFTLKDGPADVPRFAEFLYKPWGYRVHLSGRVLWQMYLCLRSSNLTFEDQVIE